ARGGQRGRSGAADSERGDRGIHHGAESHVLVFTVHIFKRDMWSSGNAGGEAFQRARRISGSANYERGGAFIFAAGASREKWRADAHSEPRRDRQVFADGGSERAFAGNRNAVSDSIFCAGISHAKIEHVV